MLHLYLSFLSFFIQETYAECTVTDNENGQYKISGDNCNSEISSQFNNSKTLFSIEIEGLQELPYGGFYQCTNLESVTFTNTLFNKLPEKIFYECTSLQSIQIPNNIQAIDGYAFNKCKEIGAKILYNPEKIPNSLDNYTCFAIEDLDGNKIEISYYDK